MTTQQLGVEPPQFLAILAWLMHPGSQHASSLRELTCQLSLVFDLATAEKYKAVFI